MHQGSKHMGVFFLKTKNNQKPKLPQSWVSDDSPASCKEAEGDALSVICHSRTAFLPPEKLSLQKLLIYPAFTFLKGRLLPDRGFL